MAQFIQVYVPKAKRYTIINIDHIVTISPILNNNGDQVRDGDSVTHIAMTPEINDIVTNEPYRSLRYKLL